MNSKLIIFFLVSSSLLAEDYLNLKNYEHIVFNDEIPATNYHQEDKSTIKMNVDASASIRLMVLEKEKAFRKILFLWRTEGKINTKDAKHEASKSGDDFWLRVGLVLSGPKPDLPFYVPRWSLPAWFRLIEKKLKLPSDRMLYVVPGAKHKVGMKWQSPYSDSIDYLSIGSQKSKDWQQASHEFTEAVKMVGIWLMADGDNTKSKFTSWIRDLKFK